MKNKQQAASCQWPDKYAKLYQKPFKHKQARRSIGGLQALKSAARSPGQVSAHFGGLELYSAHMPI